MKQEMWKCNKSFTAAEQTDEFCWVLSTTIRQKTHTAILTCATNDFKKSKKCDVFKDGYLICRISSLKCVLVSWTCLKTSAIHFNSNMLPKYLFLKKPAVFYVFFLPKTEKYR